MGNGRSVTSEVLFRQDVYKRHWEDTFPIWMSFNVADPPLLVLFTCHYDDLSFCKRQLIVIVRLAVIDCLYPFQLEFPRIDFARKWHWHFWKRWRTVAGSLGSLLLQRCMICWLGVLYHLRWLRILVRLWCMRLRRSLYYRYLGRQVSQDGFGWKIFELWLWRQVSQLWFWWQVSQLRLRRQFSWLWW